MNTLPAKSDKKILQENVEIVVEEKVSNYTKIRRKNIYLVRLFLQVKKQADIKSK